MFYRGPLTGELRYTMAVYKVKFCVLPVRLQLTGKHTYICMFCFPTANERVYIRIILTYHDEAFIISGQDVRTET